jgi:hypothetical protein
LDTWNVCDITIEYEEMQNKLAARKIDIPVLTETKKKMQWASDLTKI